MIKKKISPSIAKKTRKSPDNEEEREQIGFVSWFRRTFPSLLIFAIPNGEKRSISVAKRIKISGGVSGIPDLCICFPGGLVIWVEMKKIKGGVISDKQKNIHDILRSLGHTVIIGNGAVNASTKLLEIFNNIEVKHGE